MDNEQILTTLLANRYELYKAPIIRPAQFLEQYLPIFIQQLLRDFWSLDLAVCIAGSAASYAAGVVQYFQDIDIFLTSEVLR